MTSPGCIGTISGNVIQGNLIGVDATGTRRSATPGRSPGQLHQQRKPDRRNRGRRGQRHRLQSCKRRHLARHRRKRKCHPRQLDLREHAGRHRSRSGRRHPNDLGDGDTGANNLQNFPVISSVVHGASTTRDGPPELDGQHDLRPRLLLQPGLLELSPGVPPGRDLPRLHAGHDRRIGQRHLRRLASRDPSTAPASRSPPPIPPATRPSSRSGSPSRSTPPRGRRPAARP